MQVDLPAAEGSPHGPLAALFAEELGLLLEVAPEQAEAVRGAYAAQGLAATPIGRVTAGREVSISVGGQPCISGARRAVIDWAKCSKPGLQSRHMLPGGFFSPQYMRTLQWQVENVVTGMHAGLA